MALDDGRSSSDSAQEGASSRSRETPADPGAGPEAHLDGGEIRHAVRACLQELVAPRRRAVTLYLMGDSVPRAAERLGWSRKRTENLVFRGLADLRGCLSARGMTP